ncbi:MAG: histidine ammonia-lyase, partial [Actinomycetota bacterium]
MPAEVTIGIDGLSQETLLAIARKGAKVSISSDAASAINKSRAIVDSLAASEIPVYGISTGFGALARKFIDADKRVQLQKSLIRSHAAGSGEIVEVEVVRAMMA